MSVSNRPFGIWLLILKQTAISLQAQVNIELSTLFHIASRSPMLQHCCMNKWEHGTETIVYFSIRQTPTRAIFTSSDYYYGVSQSTIPNFCPNPSTFSFFSGSTIAGEQLFMPAHPPCSDQRSKMPSRALAFRSVSDRNKWCSSGQDHPR
jgi:hypothetical protein